ncbi:hypothetical protein vBPpSSYP_26 [Pseudomonas phage vB_PpS_SYP]|nr:hypothetical protein vBPpSSYP_26 [Pseudomonas phage vB_PpS_SYP]
MLTAYLEMIRLAQQNETQRFKKMEVFLQFGKAGEPMRTVAVPHKQELMKHHHLELSFTRTGYGSKIPSMYKVQYQGRWYRVYSICYSNVSTEYIVVKGERVTVQFYH